MAAILLILLVGQSVGIDAEAQWGYGRRRFADSHPPRRDIFPGRTFQFCTIEYGQVRREPLGLGWSTDWPDAGLNFMIRLAELTTIKVARYPDGKPEQVSLRLYDEALFDFPYIFMSDVGTVGLNTEEVEALRSYLLRGGFLHVDDFWGPNAWKHWALTIGEVLPPDTYQIKDIPLNHDIFHIVFDVKEVPQVPSINYWNTTRNDPNDTSEQGLASATPHLRGIWDTHGRLMVVMSHNTDLADGWERETANEEYFREFSVKKSYPISINIVVYAMTH